MTGVVDATVRGYVMLSERNAARRCEGDGCESRAVAYLRTDETSTLFVCSGHLADALTRAEGDQ